MSSPKHSSHKHSSSDKQAGSHLFTQLRELRAELERVKQQRDELLMACNALVFSTDYDEDTRPLMYNLRAAITNAEKETVA